MKPKSPFHDMLQTELVSLDKEPKAIQWPLQQELTSDDDVLHVSRARKVVRQKFVGFCGFLFSLKLYLYEDIKYGVLVLVSGFK